MTQKIEINCDFCGKSLKFSRGGYDYVLSLKNRKIGPEGSVVLGYFSYPPIKHDCDFCGLQCLKKWIENDMKPMEKNESKT